MADVTDAIQSVREFVFQPIISYDAFPLNDRLIFDDKCFTDLLELCHPLPREVHNKVLGALTPLLDETPDGFQAGRVAMLCGILVEWGADASIAVSLLLDRLAGQMSTVLPFTSRAVADERALFEEAPDVVKAWKALPYVVLPTMTMLCSDIRGRRMARANPDLIAGIHALAPLQRHIKFLARLLSLVDDEELIVLHPAERKGFRVRLEAIASNFHLFTLLQGTLVGDPAQGFLTGPRPNRKVIATATGEMPHDRLITDAPLWSYANWTEQGMTPIPGEGSPRGMAEFQSERIVLLGAPTKDARGWDSTFFTNLHDLLRSKVEIVEILSAGEVEAWLKRIQ